MITNRQYLADKSLTGLQVPVRVFADEWNACYRDRSRDATTLFRYLDPVIDNWVSMFQIPSHPKNIAYMSLLSRLESTDKLALMSQWGSEDDLRSALTEVYVWLLRNMSTSLLGFDYEIAYMFQRSLVLKLTHVLRGYQGHQRRAWYAELQADMDCHAVELDTQLNDVLLDIRSSPYVNYLVTMFLADELDREMTTDLRRALDEYKARIT